MSRDRKTPEKIKSKGLFDHINHIRKIQSKSYFDDLSDADKKSFNHYMIIRILSMDEDLIDEMCLLSKYFDKIPSDKFYSLLIEIVPKTNKYSKYVKSNTKQINEDILNCLCAKFQLGTDDVSEYYNILNESKNGRHELITLLSEYGYSDKEIKKIIKI